MVRTFFKILFNIFAWFFAMAAIFALLIAAGALAWHYGAKYIDMSDGKNAMLFISLGVIFASVIVIAAKAAIGSYLLGDTAEVLYRNAERGWRDNERRDWRD